MMTKITKKIMQHIPFLLLLGLSLGYGSTLHAVEGHNETHEDEEKATIATTTASEALKDWTCTSIRECTALVAIIDSLAYWQTLNKLGKLDHIVGHCSSTNSYGHIVGAFHHLLDRHLGRQGNQDEYHYIHQQMAQKVVCDFAVCKAYTRNQRLRGHLERKTSENSDEAYLFVRDLMDTIHAYLLHGMDSGHRYVDQDKLTETNNTAERPQLHTWAPSEHKEKTGDNGYLCLDPRLKTIQAWQRPIKKKQRNQNRQGKFQTTIAAIKRPEQGPKVSLDILAAKFGHHKAFSTWMAHLLADECDTDNVLLEIEAQSERVITIDQVVAKELQTYIKLQQADSQHTIGGYGFGVRLYYWDYYKYSTEDDWNGWAKTFNYNPGYQQKDVYVAPAYLSFKNEILSKKEITIGTWDQKMYTARMLLRLSPTLKKCKGYDAKYGIDYARGLSVAHVLAVLLYTDVTVLCENFGRSFRYLSDTESIRDIIKRNTKWHYLAKNLREVVEIFGEWIGWDAGKNTWGIDKGSFYHGVSGVLFSAVSMHFYGPLSTSRELEVALLFTSNEGLVVQLQQGAGILDRDVKFFNVSLISSFAAEEERLFIGGYAPLQISSICLLKDNANLQPFIHALFVLEHIIKGKNLYGAAHQVTYADTAICKKLLSSSPDLPYYIQQLWMQFKHGKKRIVINLHFMYTHYILFTPLLFASDEQCKNLLRLDQIATIFPNVTEIICENTDFMGDHWNSYSSLIVGAKLILGVKGRLSTMDKHAKLKKIVIRTGLSPIKGNCSLYTRQFSDLGWHIQKENDWSICVTKIRGASPQQIKQA